MILVEYDENANAFHVVNFYYYVAFENIVGEVKF